MTTIRQDFGAAAQRLVELLLAAIEGEGAADPAQSVELPVELIVRESA